MTFWLVPALPMTREHLNMWKAEGAWIRHRKWTPSQLLAQWEAGFHDHDFILNYGNSAFCKPQEGIADHNFWNDGTIIQQTRTPGALRRFMPDLLPPIPEDGTTPAWLKGPGYRGRNKTFLQHGYTGHTFNGSLLDGEWDLQLHIPGSEYRINTVGHKIVQAHRSPGHTDGEWQWIRRRETPEAVREAAKEAARKVGPFTVYAWDIMFNRDSGCAYILEGNSAPGTNAHTVRRILTAIEKQRNHASN